jgi:transcriptional regulator with XRE-family HTH domain
MGENLRQIIAERITTLVKESEKSQKEIAKDLDISPQALTDYKSARRVGDIENLVRLADYFGTSLDYLAGRSDCKSPRYDRTNKRLGLGEPSIKILEALARNQRDLAPVLFAVNVLLQSAKGREILALIDYYIFSDFEIAYPSYKDAPPDMNTPMNKIAFMPKHASDRMPVDVDSRILSYGMLQKIMDGLIEMRNAAQKLESEKEAHNEQARKQ